MQARGDLTGRQFGALTVLERGPRVSYGNCEQWSWKVMCSCGRTEFFPQKRLTSKKQTACTYCSRPRCERCGKPFTRTAPGQRYCSEDCAIEAERASFRRYYHKRAADPEYRKKRSIRAAMLTSTLDDAGREKRREWSDAHRKRVSADPERTERRREYDREWARAKRALMRMDPEEYDRWRRERNERLREYQRLWRKKWYARLTPEQRAEMASRAGERRRRQALDELWAIVATHQKGKDK